MCGSPHLPLARQLKSGQGRGRDGLSPWHRHPWGLQLPTCPFGGRGRCHPPPPHPRQRQIQHRSDGQRDAESHPGCIRIPRGSRRSLCQFSTDEEGRTGWVSRQKPPAPARSRGGVSLTAHNTASSFLFLFSVLLAKQHNVYTSGYYICQNNYGMTNGTSM